MTNYPSESDREFFPNVLIICGSGRDTGKTTLGCNIIKRWKDKESITAIKISRHVHEQFNPMKEIFKGKGFNIWEETGRTRKDSGRYIEAGASRVFYVEAEDESLLSAFHYLVNLSNRKSLIICESGGLGSYIRPGAMVFVQYKDEVIQGTKAVQRKLSNRILFSTDREIEDPSRLLSVSNNAWALLEN